jgi:hypothetical protein
MIVFSDNLKAKITKAAQADSGQIPDYVTFNGLRLTRTRDGKIHVQLLISGEPMADFPPFPLMVTEDTVTIDGIEIKTKIVVTQG